YAIFGVLFFATLPPCLELCGRFSARPADAPARYCFDLFAISTVAYLPLAFVFGVSSWAEIGPFDWQPDRPLLYLVYFFAGVGIGVQGYDRGLLRARGLLACRWHFWIGAAAISFLFL